MLYEKTVSSLPQLMREIDVLDLDSGIRTFASYKGKRGFAFLTRSLNGYTLMIYGITRTRRKKKSVLIPGKKRLFVEEFSNQDELVRFIRSTIVKPVKAFVY